MFRKRKLATPGFGHTPWNAIHGEQANLRQDGTAPYCAMMQVAAEDTYDDYVICRGFDPRILRFVDYAAGNPNKPGISVAKPFGKRTAGAYEIAEVYPALLPTQGNAGLTDFRQVVYTPPSPVAVDWRVGQNPGVVTGGLDGGQPGQLTDPIEILYDHNGKAVNWLLLDTLRQRRQWIGYLYESYNGVVAGMWVVPTLKLDGQLPPFSRVYVYNIYKWNFGLIGATIRVEEDRVNDRWVGLQQEYICPTPGASFTVTPPPVSSGLNDGVP